MKRILKIVLPVLIVTGASLGAWWMIKSKPEVETKKAEVLPPLVRLMTAEKSDVRYTVYSQGTVSPRTESQLVPEVSGRVMWVSPSFISGGFFEAGDVLLKIDPVDYENAVVLARANVAQSKLSYEMEKAEAEVAREEWADLQGEEEATPLTLRVPQLANAKATYEAAEAALRQAERDLERTEVKALFAGRVRRKNVDVGEFVTVGSPVATLYSVDVAEIRLPVEDRDLAYVDLPLDYRGQTENAPGPEVELIADFAGRQINWQGRIVRTEGEIDAMSRLVHVVAQVRDPYGRSANPGRPPLAVGLYVRAEIRGRLAEDVVVLPRAALHGGATVWVIDEEGRLRFREVEVLRAGRKEVVIGSGLEAGERICLSPLEAVTDGMKVRTGDEDEAGADDKTGDEQAGDAELADTEHDGKGRKS